MTIATPDPVDQIAGGHATVFVDLARKLSTAAAQVFCAALRRLTDHAENTAKSARAAR